MLAIGLMSGTSLDGIDVALCKITGVNQSTKIELLDFYTYPLSNGVKKKIKRACLSEDFTTKELCSLNFEFGHCLSKAVKQMLLKNNLSSEQLDFVASHGQTIYHLPNPKDQFFPSTLQIGEPSVISYEHNVDVIADFRVMDMAAHGQGAPLVPFSEKILYGEKNKTIGIQNIGGIGNITVIKEQDILAFDTGPGNMMIDEAMNILYKKSYDDQGKIAAKGKVDLKLWQLLINHPYLKKSIPKTTGREDFGEQYVKELLKDYEGMPEDVITTFTKFTAFCIYDSLQKAKIQLTKLIIGGGGAHNLTLIKMLQEYLKEVKVVTQEDLGFNSDAKEAMAFVILGNQTLQHQPSNVITATGAKEEVILGKVIYRPRRKNNE